MYAQAHMRAHTFTDRHITQAYFGSLIHSFTGLSTTTSPLVNKEVKLNELDMILEKRKNWSPLESY